MEAIAGFKYKRHAKALKTSEFSYEDVVTPGPKQAAIKIKKHAKKGNMAKPACRAENPRHDPNAKTRPSKRRNHAADDDDGVKVADKKRARGKQQHKQRAKKTSSRGHGRKEEKLIAPMYPTDVMSGTALRERVNDSTDADKLHALFHEVLRGEAGLVAKNFKGKFQFVVNAVKGVGREFMQAMEETAATHTEGVGAGGVACGVARNSRNVALAEKKASLQGILTTLQKEEADWTAARARIQRQQKEECAAPAERPITTDVSTAELQSVQDIVTQSVQGISLQVDTLQKTLVASRHLSDATMHTKDQLSEQFATFTHARNGGTDTPRKIIKNLLRGPVAAVAY